MLCSELQRQLDKPQVWFYKYFPTRIKNVGEREINDRKVIYDLRMEEHLNKLPNELLLP